MSWVKVATLEIPGIPKPRAKFKWDPKHGKIYPDKTSDGWKAVVFLETRSKGLPKVTGPVKLEIDFYLPRPVRLMKKKDPDGPILHDRMPDRDNLEKTSIDSMVAAGLLEDDGQICDGLVRKFYHAKGGQPGATIRIWRWES